jgi:hypothetical protein
VNKVALSLVAMLTAIGIIPAQAATTGKNVSITHFSESKSTGIYMDKFSYGVGEPLKAYIACPRGKYGIRIYRVNNFYIRDTDQVYQELNLPCIPGTSDSTKWSSIKISTQLTPGVYLTELKDASKYESFAPFVVPDNQNHHAGIAVVPFQTLYAYNLWSGKSAYTGDGDFENRDRIIQLHQPLSISSGLAKFVSYVAPLVGEIESKHLDVSYIADTYLSSSSNPLIGHNAYISMGHDEYWTKLERNYVLAARNSGANLLFFGANVAYWNVRLSNINSNPVMEIYKDAAEDPDKSNPTIKFIDQGLPESQLTGIEYNCFPVVGKFKVVTPNPLFFAGVNPNDISKYPKLVGPEVDGVVANDHGFNGKMEDIATAPVTCRSTGSKPHGTSDIVYGVSANKTGTVAFGTMSWIGIGLRSGSKLPIGAFTQKITDNVLEAALKGKLGDSYPIN